MESWVQAQLLAVTRTGCIARAVVATAMLALCYLIYLYTPVHGTTPSTGVCHFDYLAI
jgi:hypothetical protein